MPYAPRNSQGHHQKAAGPRAFRYGFILWAFLTSGLSCQHLFSASAWRGKASLSGGQPPSQLARLRQDPARDKAPLPPPWRDAYEEGQPPEIESRFSQFKKLYAAVQKRDIEALAVALDSGADPNAQGPLCWTILHYSAEAGWTGGAALLLDAGADIELKTCPFESHGEGSEPLTAFDLALRSRAEEIARLLAERTDGGLLRFIRNWRLNWERGGWPADD